MAHSWLVYHCFCRSCHFKSSTSERRRWSRPEASDPAHAKGYGRSLVFIPSGAVKYVVYKAMLQCDNCLLLIAFFSDVWYLGTGRADGDLV